ncbi:MAG: hypothetical protein DMG63_13645 [Acidobacteria bacterium]|nr:MAG: hypothetical protein DMG63_13645 [Acidobacteriota bacterium]
MSALSTRKRVYLAMACTLALGFLLPPTINLNHFRVRFSESLSRSMGRPVSIQDVRLRLLPIPGFTFRRLRISDDYEFGAEPILLTSEEGGQRSVATLRWSSLWRGRFEVASISLTQASLNIVQSPGGHWNLERLINRAAQVPSAPTGKKQAEARSRFPYIELNESRINFKFGAEKKPFALSDAEFALWLAAENRWNVRLKAIPLRTDERVTDTGLIRVSGSFDRAPQFSSTPFHLQASWERPEVNAITLITRGHDPGWRGAVEVNSELKGTPDNFSARLLVSIDEFRRFDIARYTSFNLRVSCENHFFAETPIGSGINQWEFNCRVPLESGVLTAQGKLHALASPDISVRLVASKVPISPLLRAALHAKSALPDDLSGEGVLDGTWSIEGTAGGRTKWSGAATARDVVIESRVLDSPLTFPRVVTVNFSSPELPPAQPRHKVDAQATASRAILEPVILDLGGEAQLSASFDAQGYRVDLDGPVDWQRLMQTARVLGLNPPKTDLRGSGIITAQYSGEWRHFSPPSVAGQAQIRSAVLSLRGFSEPLMLGASSGLSIPFLNSRRFEAKWLLDVPCDGTITADHLKIGNFEAKHVVAQLELASAKVLVRNWTADAFGGQHMGEAAFDFSGPRAAITGTGSLKRVRVEDAYGEAAEPLGTGSLDIDYRLAMNGRTMDELTSSASGSGGFTWRNGEIRSLHFDDLHDPALTFALWTGRFIVEKQRVALQNTRMTSASGMRREVVGQISFKNEWNLRFVRADGSGFVASGKITDPSISSDIPKLAEARQ